MTADEIKKCKYHPEDNPLCPIFRVGDVLNYTGQNITELLSKVSMSVQGRMKVLSLLGCFKLQTAVLSFLCKASEVPQSSLSAQDNT